MQKRVTQSLIVKVFWTFSHTDDAYSANEMELLLKTLPINSLLVKLKLASQILLQKKIIIHFPNLIEHEIVQKSYVLIIE